MIKLTLIEYYQQFIEIVTHLYKPSCRGNLNVKDPSLISTVKTLHERSVSISSISRFFTGKRYKNIEHFDHQELLNHFVYSNVSKIKVEYHNEEPIIKGRSSEHADVRNNNNNLACDIFSYYASKVDSINSKMVPSTKEIEMINARLKTNSIARLKDAIDGATLTPYIASKGYPLSMIFHTCSKINELIIIKQRGGVCVEDRKTQNIREAMQAISSSQIPHVNSPGFKDIIEHQDDSELDNTTTLYL